MERRKFIKKVAAATGALAAAPYILPSGRLFAATGARKVNHVVFCLFAGGVRSLESVHKNEGNLMPHILKGNEPISNDISGGMDPLPSPSGLRLSEQGTLFREFRYKQGPTGHINGHNAAITGRYNDNSLDLQARPATPTLFEYYRKHSDPAKSALNAWWVSNQLGAYTDFNYSSYPGYGALYGANLIAPTNLISGDSFDVLGNPKNFGAQEAQIQDLRSFFNGNFKPGSSVAQDLGVINSEEDRFKLQQFIQQLFSDASNGLYNDPWGVGGVMNNDMYNLFFAEKIIEEYQPELLVVNMFDVDIGHQNYTQYCNNLRKSDYALAHLWETIQSTPGMANDTVLIAVPEHGRNEQANTLVDAYGRFALDHTSDQMSREIFCLIAGPPGVIKQDISYNQEMGESIDIVPTIADILGFHNDIPAGMLPGSILNQAYV